MRHKGYMAAMGYQYRKTGNSEMVDWILIIIRSLEPWSRSNADMGLL